MEVRTTIIRLFALTVCTVGTSKGRENSTGENRLAIHLGKKGISGVDKRSDINVGVTVEIWVLSFAWWGAHFCCE